MEKGIHDIALDQLHELRGRVRERLYKEYKGKKPFRMEPVSDDFHLYVYDNMTEEDVGYAMQTYGEEAVNDWMFEVNKTKQRRK